MKYRCRITWELHDIPCAGDVLVGDNINIHQTVRVIICQMLTEQQLEFASPIYLDITETKVIADLKVIGRPNAPLTFEEAKEGIDQ